MMAPSKRAKQARREAERGSVVAQLALGCWHVKGEEGLQQDDVKAAAWFREAADLGDVTAQNALACCYYQGQWVEKDYALAEKWMRKAADQGLAVSQFSMGSAYARGEVGVKMDLPLGKTYLELSAAQGNQGAVALLKRIRKAEAILNVALPVAVAGAVAVAVAVVAVAVAKAALWATSVA
jgi:TPR repeat protein